MCGLGWDHAAEDLGRFWRVADRIDQLGGSPDLNPATMKEPTTKRSSGSLRRD